MRGLRVALFAWAALIGAIACGQVPMWRCDVDQTVNGRIARDASGYIYMAYPIKDVFNVGFAIQKVSPLGQVVYTENQVFSIGSMYGYQIKDFMERNGKLYTVVRVMQDANFSYYDSYTTCTYAATGDRDWLHLGGTREATCVTVLPTGDVVIGGTLHPSADPYDNRPFTQKLNGTNGSPMWTQDYGSVQGEMLDITSDSTGKSYATGWTTGLEKPNTLVVCSQSNGSDLIPIITLPTNYIQSFGTKIALNEATDRLYVFGEGSNGRKNAFLQLIRLSDFSTLVTRTITDPDRYLWPGDLAVDSQGAWISGFLDGATVPEKQEMFRHYSTAGGFSWTHLEQAGLGDQSLVVDANGDCFASMRDSGGSRIVRLNKSSGAVKFSATYNAGGFNTPTQVLTDPAGAVYLVGNAQGWTQLFLAKIQQAKLDIAPLVIGGSQTSATLTLVTPAPAGGATFTLTSSSQSATVQGTTTVAEGQTTKSFFINTTPVVANTSVTINAKYGGYVLQTQFSIAAPAALTLTANPQSTFGGVNMAGTVTLDGKAPAGGKQVTLSSSDTTSATVPASVWVPAGSTSAGFTITTKPVLVNKGVVITGTTGVVSRTCFIAVNAPWLTSFTVSPSSVKGGNPATLTLTLNGKAPASYSVQLVSGSTTHVTVPSSTLMTAGSATKTVGITTHAVTSTVAVTIIAYRGPYVKTTTITLTP